MTLSELWADREKLRAWLGLDEAELRRRYLVENPWHYDCGGSSGFRYGSRKKPMSESYKFKAMTADDLAFWLICQHVEKLQAEWYKKNRDKTAKGLKRECLSALGVKGGGSVEDRLSRYMASRPDIYQTAEQLEAEENTARACIGAMVMASM